jgi:hypothetical protein
VFFFPPVKTHVFQPQFEASAVCLSILVGGMAVTLRASQILPYFVEIRPGELSAMMAMMFHSGMN